MVKYRKKQIEYLKYNYDVDETLTPEQNPEKFGEVYNDLCDIEIHNAVNGEKDEMVTSLVTTMGNMIKEYRGWE